MKDLIEIIENLHNINTQVIEKDNYINNFKDIIGLFKNLVSDSDFIKSDIYLDLKIKYINPIELALKRITESKPITIEPQAVFTKKTASGKPSRKFTSDEVTAPLTTDIYQAPGCRKVLAKKKPVVKPTLKDKTSNVTAQIEDAEPEVSDKVSEPYTPQYLEFEYQDQSYFIDTNPVDKTYSIYNLDEHQSLELAGNLCEGKLTLLNFEDLEQSNVIVLEKYKGLVLKSDDEALSYLHNYLVK